MQAPRDKTKDRHARKVVAYRIRTFFRALNASAQKETDALIERIKRLLHKD
jgi:hypothetical protein